LSERTTKVVIMIVLIMLFFQPIFSESTYVNTPAASDLGLIYLSRMYEQG